MSRAYLSLGSNLHPAKHLRAALTELAQAFGVLQISPVYQTAAVGFDGPDFLNLAVGLDTDLGPSELNQWLHALEDRSGRRRDVPRFSDRTLDADIILFDNLVMRGAQNLELPRSELKHAFVLKPLADVAPHLMHPTLHRSLADLWQDLSETQSDTLREVIVPD